MFVECAAVVLEEVGTEIHARSVLSCVLLLIVNGIVMIQVYIGAGRAKEPIPVVDQ